MLPTIIIKSLVLKILDEIKLLPLLLQGPKINMPGKLRIGER